MSNLTAITLCVLAFLLAATALVGLAGVLVAARRNARMLVVVPAEAPAVTHAPASASPAPGSSTARTRDLQE